MGWRILNVDKQEKVSYHASGKKIKAKRYSLRQIRFSNCHAVQISGDGSKLSIECIKWTRYCQK